MAERLHDRIDTLAATAIAGLRPERRRHRAATFDAAARQDLQTAMRGWVGSLHRAAPAFAERVLGLSPDHPAAGALHEAARLVAAASTLTDMRAATDALARGMEAVGLDHWRDYPGRAAERAQGLDLRIASGAVPKEAGPVPPFRGQPQSSIADGNSDPVMQTMTSASTATPSPPRSEMAAEPQTGATAQVPLAPMTRFYAQRKDRDRCIERCSEIALPTRDYGVSYRRCLATCSGETIWPEWEGFFFK